jgi:hypothetical protein
MDKCTRRQEALAGATASILLAETLWHLRVQDAYNYEENQTGFLCDEHVEGYPHDNYGEPMPLVNSPRLGMCGYTGPAEPPN